MSAPEIVVAGGGAAGFMAAIVCAVARPDARVTLLEKGARYLDKVRISGGGRCNVTHACFDPRELVERYPRGAKALIGAFHRFQPRDTVEWFEARGVALKTERDGRMFPTTDRSETVVDCLVNTARAAGVALRLQSGVEHVTRRPDGGFVLMLVGGTTMGCDRLLLATGGCRGTATAHPAATLGHTMEPPVPSLFTFQIAAPWLTPLAGVSVDPAEVSVPGTPLRERGPVLVTHWGLSGPAILRLSAWGARILAGMDYRFALHVDWLPALRPEDLAATFQAQRRTHSTKLVLNAPFASLPSRLWAGLATAAGVGPTMRWADLSRAVQQRLTDRLRRTELSVTGKSLNKEEFVTCGGVRLAEVNFKTMESRLVPGLHFAGELLDIDGITGGFNFQAAWTTGWLAGRAMAADTPTGSPA